MSSAPTAKVDGTVLTGVSETALLTLNARASEARRPDAVIDDSMAITLADSIDFDFRGPNRLGSGKELLCFRRRESQLLRAQDDNPRANQQTRKAHSRPRARADEL